MRRIIYTKNKTAKYIAEAALFFKNHYNGSNGEYFTNPSTIPSHMEGIVLDGNEICWTSDFGASCKLPNTKVINFPFEKKLELE